MRPRADLPALLRGDRGRIGTAGKLKAAARYWARGGETELAEAASDAEVLGLPAEAVATLRAAERDFEVWPANWDAVLAFLAVQTQWRIVGLGGGMAPGRTYYVGLDYTGVAAGLAGAGVAATPALWADLRTIEVAARNILNGVST